jgi:RimJ/RimL family protein N-acetyltransferase
MSAYVGQALKELGEQRSLPFAVRLNDAGTIVGTTRFFNIQHNRRRMEIGFTWYARSCQRSVVNTECKLLLLEQAFDALNCIAIAWLVHSLNFRSREAVLKLGAKLDGVMRNYLVMPDGTLADLALYSVTCSEWPAVKVHLSARAERLRRQNLCKGAP